MSLARVAITGAFSLDCTRPLAEHPWIGAAHQRMPKIARMDRFCALALAAADGALASAGLDPFVTGEWNPEETAIVVGSVWGCHVVNEDYYRGFLREGVAGASPRLFALTLPSSPAGEISIHFDVRGPVLTFTSGRVAGVEALAEAAATITRARAMRALCIFVDQHSALLQSLAPDTRGARGDVVSAFVLEIADLTAKRGQVPLAFIEAYAHAYRRAQGPQALLDARARALASADRGATSIELLSCGDESVDQLARTLRDATWTSALVGTSDPEGVALAALLTR